MFVGRDRELAALDAALSRATGANGQLILLAGEPGIGKSRLAAETAAAAHARGIHVSWGRCWEAGGAPAFWPWREVMEALGVEFPATGSIPGSDPDESRFALFRAVAGALAHAAAREPLLIILEDLHAADRSSLLLLELVAGQLRTLPMMVIGTYRDLEASLRADASDAIGRLGRAGQVLQLARLGPAEVGALVRESIEDADERLAARVFDTTQGNPLFVDELVRDVRAHGLDAGMPLPLGVREVIRQRLGLVSAEARAVLEAAAVLGVEFGVSELGRMAPDSEAVIEDATRSGLVSVRGPRVRFAHALYREALYHDLPRARRQALHRDAARAVAVTGALLAETTHHLLEGGPEAAPDAIDHAIRAAALALDVFAFEDAAALLERARAAIPSGPLEPLLRARVLIAIGEARIRNGDRAGRELCVEAAQLARTLGDANLIAHAALAYGAVFTMASVDPMLVGLLEEALAAQPDEDSALRARLMARLGAGRQPNTTTRDVDVQLALDAIAMARRVAQPRELLGVLHSASGALYGEIDPAVRLSNSLEQERLAEELGDTTRLLHARVRLAMDHLELADFAAYERLAARYEELAARVGRAAAPWRVPLMQSMLALLTDRFEESERWQGAARRIESETPAARRAQGFHHVAFLRAAERHDELRANIATMRGLWLEMPFGAALAESRVASNLARIGADDEARAILEQLPDGAFVEGINASAIAEAVWATGDPAHAARILPLMSRYGERWQIYWLDVEIVEASNGRLLAYLHAILGDWHEADRLFARALRGVEAVGKRSMAARMRFELGDLLVRCRREPERARALLIEARAGAAAAGLPELVALVDQRHPEHAVAAASRVELAPAFALHSEGEYFAVPRRHGTLRFKASRGMQYLARLVERPGVDVHVLDLAGSSDHADRGDAGELLDAAAFRDYRARLESLRDAVELAETLGDTDRAERARAEMEAIAGELARGTGRHGKPRRAESSVDRARSAVQRRIKDALDRIAEQDPELGASLRRAITTGTFCRYDPGNGVP